MTGLITLTAGLMPVGAFVAGVAADLVGPRTITILLSGIAGAIAVVVVFASPTIREYQLSRVLGTMSARDRR